MVMRGGLDDLWSAWTFASDAVTESFATLFKTTPENMTRRLDQFITSGAVGMLLEYIIDLKIIQLYRSYECQ